MRKFTAKDIVAINENIEKLLAERAAISVKIFKERQKLYNHRKAMKRKLLK